MGDLSDFMGLGLPMYQACYKNPTASILARFRGTSARVGSSHRTGSSSVVFLPQIVSEYLLATTQPHQNRGKHLLKIVETKLYHTHIGRFDRNFKNKFHFWSVVFDPLT
jgi:hypothetical protein